jgi:hypothetical protein
MTTVAVHELQALVAAARAIRDFGCPDHVCEHLEHIEAISEALKAFEGFGCQ